MTAPHHPESPATAPKAVGTHPTPADGATGALTPAMPDLHEEARRQLNEYPNARDCEHGSLRRSCQTCDLLDQVRTLTAERDEALRKLDRVAALGWLADTFQEVLNEDDPK